MNAKENFIPGFRILPSLLAAGWFPGRWTEKILHVTRSEVGKRWLPTAESFTGRFGGLEIGGNLVNTKPSQFLPPDPAEMDQLEKVLGLRVCPIAFASYIGEGGTVYVTETGQYFVANPAQIVFLGESLREILEVLILYIDAPEMAGPRGESVARFNHLKSLSDMSDDQPEGQT